MDSLSPDDTRLGSSRQVVEKWNRALFHIRLNGWYLVIVLHGWERIVEVVE